jgi:hypothetical protein
MFLGTFNLLKWRTIAQFFSPNLVTLAAATIRKKLLTHGETPENLSTLQNNEIRIRFTYWLHYWMTPNQRSMLWSQFSEIFENVRQKNWLCFEWKRHFSAKIFLKS